MHEPQRHMASCCVDDDGTKMGSANDNSAASRVCHVTHVGAHFVQGNESGRRDCLLNALERRAPVAGF